MLFITTRSGLLLKNRQDQQDQQDQQDSQDSQDTQDQQDTQDTQDRQDSQDTQDTQDRQDSQSVQLLQLISDLLYFSACFSMYLVCDHLLLLPSIQKPFSCFIVYSPIKNQNYSSSIGIETLPMPK
jgi:hypothetical protein